MFKQKFTKKYNYNNPTDGQETKSLGMEQGVRKVHGRSKPALKHSRVCEGEQGMPLQSTRSGTPPLREACKEAARTAQAGPAQQGHTRNSCHGSILSGTGAKMYRQPQLQPGIAVGWDTIPAATHSAGQSLAEVWECAGGGQGSHVRLWRVA